MNPTCKVFIILTADSVPRPIKHAFPKRGFLETKSASVSSRDTCNIHEQISDWKNNEPQENNHIAETDLASVNIG